MDAAPIERCALYAILALVAAVLCTPDVAAIAPLDAAPRTNLAPIACDLGASRRDLRGPVERFLLGGGAVYSRPTLAVIVVGAEGSGSKLAALTVAEAAEAGRTREIGGFFNSTCDRSAGAWDAWNGHGVHVNYCTGTLVVHRSLPHGRCFPDARALARDVAALGFPKVRVLVCARDGTATLRSKMRRHQRAAAIAANEHALATAELRSLIADPAAPTAVWSYEAYVALGGAYVAPLLAFLDLPPAGDAAGWEVEEGEGRRPPPRPTRDGNAAWRSRRTPWAWLGHAAIALVRGRPAAYAAEDTEPPL